jgi:hypothetical protein
MMIQIVYQDGRHDMVKPVLLERLIEERGISQFRRTEGWVNVAVDPVRKRGRRMYSIPERRSTDL